MGYVGEREELTWSVGCSGAPGAGGAGAPPLCLPGISQGRQWPSMLDFSIPSTFITLC